MSHWNYRIVCETMTELGITEDVWTVREVFYDDEKTIDGWSTEPVAAQGESKTGLMEDIEKMSAAASLPPLYIVGDHLEKTPASNSKEADRG